MALKRLKWVTSLNPCISIVLIGHYVGSEIIVSDIHYTLHYWRTEAVVSLSRHYPEIYWIGLKKNRGETISRASNQADN